MNPNATASASAHPAADDLLPMGDATTRLHDLRPGVVYVWEGRLDVPGTVTASARALLSRYEREWADRFVCHPR